MGKSSIDHIAALECNETAEEVDAQTRLQLPSLNIYRSHPPVPNESSVRAASAYLSVMPAIPVQHVHPINGIWQWVIQGRYGIPQEDLGRPDANDNVADA